MGILLLIPTEFERRLFEPVFRERLREHSPARADEVDDQWRIRLCGFGLVAAAAMTARAIATEQPQRVVLAGIAGGFGETVAIGQACGFDRVTCHGIGVGDCFSGVHRSAEELGWSQVETSGSQTLLGDSILLPVASPPKMTVGHLVSVTSASANELEADLRRVRFPGAIAEDMEGFAVALACKLAGVRLQIVRGISNRVGDRDHAHWQIEAALRAAADGVIELISQEP